MDDKDDKNDKDETTMTSMGVQLGPKQVFSRAHMRTCAYTQVRRVSCVCVCDPFPGTIGDYRGKEARRANVLSRIVGHE